MRLRAKWTTFCVAVVFFVGWWGCEAPVTPQPQPDASGPSVQIVPEPPEKRSTTPPLDSPPTKGPEPLSEPVTTRPDMRLVEAPVFSEPMVQTEPPVRPDVPSAPEQRQTPPDPPAPEPPPVRPLRWLHIGDSQSSGSLFASVMISFLKQPQALCSSAKRPVLEVRSYARVSAAARHWTALSGTNKDWLCRQTKIWTNGTATGDTTGPKLCAGITNQSVSVFQKLIQEHQPNAFLIQLGDNSLGFSESYVKSKVKLMLDQMPVGSTCVWVAPTYGTHPTYQPKKKPMEQWLQQAINQSTQVKCLLLTSYDQMAQQTTCTKFNASDGLHMSSCGSRLWGETTRTQLCARGSL